MDVVSFRGADGFLHEHFDNGRLDAGAQIVHPLRVVQNPGVIAEKIAHGGFQSAEAEVRQREIAASMEKAIQT